MERTTLVARTGTKYVWAKIKNMVRSNVLGIMIGLISSAGAWGAEGAGTIKTLAGSASVSRNGSVLRLAAGQHVFTGDRITTERDSYVGIMLHDDTRLTMGPVSELVVRGFDFNPDSHAGSLAVSFLKGTMRVVTGLIGKRTPEHVSFSTPTATIGIRGTDFVVDLTEEEPL